MARLVHLCLALVSLPAFAQPRAPTPAGDQPTTWADAITTHTQQVQAAGIDLVTAAPVRHGIGFGLNGPELTVSPNPRACYWGGWGGSIVINDLDAKLSFAYAMNKMGRGSLEDFRGAMLALATMGALMGTAS